MCIFGLTDTWTELNGEHSENLGNLTLESTAWLAGTETRHDFLVHGIYFNGLHYGRQGRDITWSNRSLICYVVIVIFKDEIDDVIDYTITAM